MRSSFSKDSRVNLGEFFCYSRVAEYYSNRSYFEGDYILSGPPGSVSAPLVDGERRHLYRAKRSITWGENAHPMVDRTAWTHYGEVNGREDILGDSLTTLLDYFIESHDSIYETSECSALSIGNTFKVYKNASKSTPGGGPGRSRYPDGHGVGRRRRQAILR